MAKPTQAQDTTDSTNTAEAPPSQAEAALPAAVMPPAPTGNSATTIAAVALVKMHRTDVTDGGPTTADVHPDEVLNYQNFGWRVTE